MKPLTEIGTTGRGRFGLLGIASVVMALTIAPVISGSPIGTADAAPGKAKKGYKRIVALTPFAANAMAQMGVFPKAIGQTLGGDRRYVSGLRKTPVLAMKHPKGPIAEQLTDQRPDLIFSSPRWSAGRKFMKRQVKINGGKRGKVVNADPNSVVGAYAKIRQISKLVNRRARGKRLLRQMKKSVKKNTPRSVRSRPTVMVVLGVGGVPYAFTRRSWPGDIVRRAGGQLLEGGVATNTDYGMISNEKILKEKPEVIIAIPHDEPKKITDRLKADMKKQWSGTPATENDKIYFSTDNSLLQAGTDIGRTIREVRRYLRN